MLTTIVSNQRLSQHQFLLKLNTSKKIRGLVAGQFFMCAIPGNSGLLLRRPFSISDAYGTTLEIAYKVTGRGTAMLSAINENETIDILGPFGNGFMQDKKIKHAYLTAGGIGIAPFPLLVKSLRGKYKKKIKITLFYGTKTKEEIVLTKKLSDFTDEILLATEDGTIGKKGYISTLLAENLKKLSENEKKDTMIFASGPTPMLKSIDLIAQNENISCQISAETVMGCGYGVCLGCAIKSLGNGNKTVSRGYKLACQDGPVFYSGQLQWD